MGEGGEGLPRPELSKPEVRSQLMQQPVGERVGRLVDFAVGTTDQTRKVSIIGEAEANGTFADGKPLAHLAEKKVIEKDGVQIEEPSTLDKAKAYNPTPPENPEDLDTAIRAQSDNLQSVVTVLEEMSQAGQDGTPADENAAFTLELMDENLVIRAVDEQGNYTGQQYTRTELQALPDENQRKEITEKGVWQFVPDQPTPGAETAPTETEPRSVDQIIQDEITRLQTKLSESKDLPKDEMGRIKNQLKTMMVISMADGPAGMAFKLDALKNSDANLTDTEMSQNNDLSKNNLTNLAVVMEKIGKLDPKMEERIKDYPDAGQAIANETNLVLEKSYKDVIKMIFGEDTDKKDIRQLRSVMDPNNFALMEKYAKGSAIGAVLLILLMGTAAAQQAKII